MELRVEFSTEFFFVFIASFPYIRGIISIPWKKNL